MYSRVKTFKLDCFNFINYKFLYVYYSELYVYCVHHHSSLQACLAAIAAPTRSMHYKSTGI